MGVEMVKANSYLHLNFHVLNLTCLAHQQYSTHADVKENLLGISNLCNGANLYSVPNMQLIKTYLDGNINNAICEVYFVNRGWLVLGGQDSFAHLYDVQSGQFLHKLEHSSGVTLVDVMLRTPTMSGIFVPTCTNFLEHLFLSSYHYELWNR